MANSSNKAVVTDALLAVVIIAAFATRGDALFDICKVSLDEISSCEPAVTRWIATPPTSKCCAVLRKADLKCLCGYKTSVFIPGYVDVKLAMELPSKCNLELPARC
ncbi:hypothetical protein MLD38_040477 [Melastoma candidum]|nr:hypothetical protein MLD38_040866 [Melastoma candidum]KAI4298095.1 hypothetical protein MLD38_040477 [Melastoma candidum]